MNAVEKRLQHLRDFTRALKGDETACLYRAELVAAELSRAITRLQQDPTDCRQKAVFNEAMFQLAELHDLLDLAGYHFDPDYDEPDVTGD